MLGGGGYQCYDLLQNTKQFQCLIIHSVVKKKKKSSRADKSVGVFAHIKRSQKGQRSGRTESV